MNLVSNMRRDIHAGVGEDIMLTIVRQHVEAFAHPRDTIRGCPVMMMMMISEIGRMLTGDCL